MPITAASQYPSAHSCSVTTSRPGSVTNFTPIPSSITNDCLTGTVDGPGTACRSLGETASVIGKDTFQGGIQGFGVGSGLELE